MRLLEFNDEIESRLIGLAAELAGESGSYMTGERGGRDGKAIAMLDGKDSLAR